MKKAALCWICTDLSMSPRWYGFHTMAPYSKTVHTRAMYAVHLLLMGHRRIFRLRKPSVLFAFLVIVEMCECHFKSLDMVMPR